MKYLKSYELFGGASATKKGKDILSFDWSKLNDVKEFIQSCAIFTENRNIKIDLKINFINDYMDYDLISDITYDDTYRDAFNHTKDCVRLNCKRKKEKFKFFSKRKDLYDVINMDNSNKFESLYDYLEVLEKVKARLIEIFGGYEFQKDYLEKNPNDYKDLELVGINPKIQEEFDYLFNADDMGLL